MRLRPLFLVGLVLVMTGSGVAAAAGSLAWRGLIPAVTGLVAFGLAAAALTAGITFVIKAIVPKKRRDAAQGSETTP